MTAIAQLKAWILEQIAQADAEAIRIYREDRPNMGFGVFDDDDYRREQEEYSRKVQRNDERRNTLQQVLRQLDAFAVHKFSELPTPNPRSVS